MSQDYYEILGVNKDASADDIKKQYRKMAMEHHPDKGGNEETFKKLSEAYETLSDPQKRQQYDQFGKGGAPNMGGFGGFEEMFRNGFGGFGDFFGGFGHQRQQQRVRKGQSIRIKVKLTLDDVLRGTKKKIKVDRNVLCDKCKGTGSKDGQRVTCSTCHGSGTVVHTQHTAFGVMQTQTTCPTCHGEGTSVKEKCVHCYGQGLVNKQDIIEADLPPGVLDGMTLQMTQKGHEVYNGVNGDLMILIEILQHPKFKRDEDDLICTHKINVIDAIIGNTSEIDTLDGRIKFNIEPGTQSGKILKMKGKGLPHLNAGFRGDLLIEIDIQIPTKISEEEKELLEKLRNSKNFIV